MRWKSAKVAAIAAMIFSLGVQPSWAAGKTEKIKVTFVSASLVDNNHVGNDWWYGGFVNGKEIEEGSSVTLSAESSGTLKLRAEAQEQDKIPDNGAEDAVIKVSSIKSPLNKKLNVTVVENRGRYSGNKAKWEFVFKVEKVK